MSGVIIPWDVSATRDYHTNYNMGGFPQILMKTHSIRLLCFALLLTSCSTVPVGTAIRMSSFNESKFASLDPDELRIRVALSDGFTLNVDETRLEVDLTASGQNRKETFTLDKVGEALGTRGGGLFTSAQAVQFHVLRLSGSSLRRFRELQQFVGARKTEKLNFNVLFAAKTLVKAPSKAPSAFQVWIELLLDQKEGYFTLINGYTMELKQSETH